MRPANKANNPRTPFTASEDPVPGDSRGVVLLGAGAPLAILGRPLELPPLEDVPLEHGGRDAPAAMTIPPDMPDGAVELPATALAFNWKAARVLGEFAGGLITATIPAEQCDFGLFCGQ